MASGARFWIVDVFTREKYAGNQLAVVLDTGELSAATMQRIAREMNFSETTFVAPAPVAESYATRIFTPHRELPFAGHPTIGTAMVIRKELCGGTLDCTSLTVPAGRVPVLFDASGAAWMTPPPPEFGQTHDRALLARALGLETSDLDGAFPVQTMKSPFPQTFVPIATLDAISRARFDRSLLPDLQRSGVPGSVYLFTRETRDPNAQVRARLFAPELGIEEDPATGSAAGCLAAYAAEHGYLEPGAVRATIVQGIEMVRPAELQIRAERMESGWRVQVGGHAVIVAAGELR